MRLPLIAAPALAAALAISPPLEAREITGEMGYRERIALDPGAMLIVELRDAEGALAAEARVEPEGRQVPLPFALTGGEDTAYTLRGAILVGGAAVWLSETVVIEPGTDELDLGPVPMARHRAVDFATPLRCGDARAEVAFADGYARLREGDGWRELVQEPAASGARYADPDDPGVWVWSRGNYVTVSTGGAELPECVPEVHGGLLPLIARGNEPGWMLELGPEGAIYTGDYGATRIEAPMAAPEAAEGGLRLALDEGFSVVLHDRICRDTMSGMPFPLTVSLTAGGAGLAGCGGDPRSLLTGAEWRIVALDGTPDGEDMPEGAEITLRFDDSGRVSGRAVCNRFHGGYTLTGEGLGLTGLATTMMACPEPLMAAERRVLEALERVDRFDIDTGGALVLLGADREAARAMR